MKYEVKFSCGYVEVRDLVGKYADREKTIKYLEEQGICSKCYEVRKDAEMSRTHDKVKMHYTDYKNRYAFCKTVTDSYDKSAKTISVYLPKNRQTSFNVFDVELKPIEGTPKLVAWASDIRAALLTILKQLNIEEFGDVLKNKTEAEWFMRNFESVLSNINHPECIGCEYKAKNKHFIVTYKTDNSENEFRVPKIPEITDETLKIINDAGQKLFGNGEAIKIKKFCDVYRGPIEIVKLSKVVWKK